MQINPCSCGGKAKICVYDPGPGGFLHYFVQCIRCGQEGERYLTDHSGEFEEAIQMWNEGQYSGVGTIWHLPVGAYCEPVVIGELETRGRDEE